MAEPINDIVVAPTRRYLRAWKVSDAEAKRGASTAWTRDKAFGTHVCVPGLLRSFPMYESWISGVSGKKM